MLDKVRRLFSRGPREPEPIDLLELHDRLQRSVVDNRVKFLENEREIAKLRLRKEHEEKELTKISSEALKRCTTRRIRSIQDRILRLDKCGEIYNQNIDLHEAIVEKIENMRVAGMKTATVQQFEEITCDLEEQRQAHRELIGSAKAMLFERPEEYND